jgi:tungstate transport system ATP-binding protein
VAEPLISLERVGLRYGAHEALRDVDLRIEAGQCVGIVGANGSGKSTLLRILHGLLRPSTGLRREGVGRATAPSQTAWPAAEASGNSPRVLSGEPLPSVPVPAPRLRCAMLFQRPFLLRRSVEGNVRLGLWLAGVKDREARKRCDEALQRVGLSGEAKRPARALSGGQQQRLALARAWALQPDVLLLDEPTASLDPSAKREIESLLAEFASRGMTLLMASHNLGQVKRLAERVVYLEHGRVLADVPAAQFFAGAVPEEARLFLKGELPW